MDIIIPLETNELMFLLNNDRDYTKQPGYHYHVCWKRPRRAVVGDLLYFHVSDKIVGYGKILSILKVNDEVQTQLAGQLWRHKNKIIITWLKSYWYETPIGYIKNIKKLRFRYFDLKRYLGDCREPAIKSEEVICKQKPINQKKAIKILKK